MDGWGTGVMVFVTSGATFGPPKRTTGWRGEMTELDDKSLKEPKYGRKKKTPSSQPVPQSQSKKNISCCPPPPRHSYRIFKRLCRPVVQGGMGALTSAGFSHNCEESRHRRTGTDQPGGWLPREEGRGSLLFAGGELADLAGCGDSFT